MPFFPDFTASDLISLYIREYVRMVGRSHVNCREMIKQGKKERYERKRQFRTDEEKRLEAWCMFMYIGERLSCIRKIESKWKAKADVYEIFITSKKEKEKGEARIGDLSPHHEWWIPSCMHYTEKLNLYGSLSQSQTHCSHTYTKVQTHTCISTHNVHTHKNLRLQLRG